MAQIIPNFAHVKVEMLSHGDEVLYRKYLVFCLLNIIFIFISILVVLRKTQVKNYAEIQFAWLDRIYISLIASGVMFLLLFMLSTDYENLRNSRYSIASELDAGFFAFLFAALNYGMICYFLTEAALHLKILFLKRRHPDKLERK